ncbi:MAG: FKBP-type peptidyl-prolyl cis-trans isomerase [Prevotellaceae bacterium]|nr:FKBP-type peptidyl-prolyl cis-trans isomerase [Prevotellaceae bacterium]
MAFQLGLDTTAVLDDFLEGFSAAIKDNSDKAKAYRAGLTLGDRVGGQFDGFEDYFFAGDSTKTVNRDAFILAFYQVAKNADLKMTVEEMNAFVEALQSKLMEQEFGANKAAGEAFLAANATKPGVVVLPSGLQYRIITEGKGEIPAAGSDVKVKYTGRLIDGTVFDESGATLFQVNTERGVIDGWLEVLKMMPVGSKWEIFIPQELAYGSNSQGQIQPFSALIFDIEMAEIVK